MDSAELRTLRRICFLPSNQKLIESMKNISAELRRENVSQPMLETSTAAILLNNSSIGFARQ
jgi:hypothetical protein